MRKYQLFCLIAILPIVCCTYRKEQPNSAQTFESQVPAIAEHSAATEDEEKSVEVIIRERILEEPKQRSLLRTWGRIPNHRVYRAVRRSDIKVPNWVKQEYYWGVVEGKVGG